MQCTIWTTKNCNLKCKYCYEKDNFETGMMKQDIEKKTFSFIKEMLLNSCDDQNYIQFHGGEPLLNFDLIKRFVEKIEEIKGNKNVKYMITTNGTIWSNEIEEFFKKYKDSFSGYISISIDGNLETHNKNRVFENNIGSFDVALKTSKKMREIFDCLRCRVTVAPNTVEYLYDNILFLIKEGFKQISIAFDFFSKEWNENHIQIIEEQYNRVLKYWDDNKLSVEISVVDDVIKPRRLLGICNPSKHFYIDGTIYPCTYVVGMENYNIGNVFDSIDEKKIKNIIELSKNDNSDCKNCNNKKTCNSNRCKLMNKVVTGNYYKPPIISCILENIQIEMANKRKN
jgi:uncharacterized protein